MESYEFNLHVSPFNVHFNSIDMMSVCAQRNSCLKQTE